MVPPFRRLKVNMSRLSTGSLRGKVQPAAPHELILQDQYMLRENGTSQVANSDSMVCSHSRNVFTIIVSMVKSQRTISRLSRWMYNCQLKSAKDCSYC